MSIPRLHSHLHPPADLRRVLYRCQNPACGAYRRLRRYGPRCFGTVDQPHPQAPFEAVTDEGQEETPNLREQQY